MSSSTIIQKDKPVKFLNWLYYRLKNQYNEEDIVLARLADIVHNYTIVNTSINRSYIDNICKKHFIEYDLEDDFGGFTADFKEKLRNLIVGVISDIGMNFDAESNPKNNTSNDKTDFILEPMG